jgi:hypothetical protein
MTAVTNFTAVDEGGFPVLADAHGNNVAFRCLGCGAPVLAVVLAHQRGSSPTNPSICRACQSRFWVEPKPGAYQLVVHRVS